MTTVFSIDKAHNGDKAEHEQEGLLQVKLDAFPEERSVSSDTVIVTVEAPVVGQSLTKSPDVSFILDGTTWSARNVIHWSPSETSLAILSGGMKEPLTRVRVVLKGHVIWSDSSGRRLFLDGQAFGSPIVGPDGTARTALIFPSGNGERASDFESWFYLPTAPRPEPLQVTRVRFIAKEPDGIEHESWAGFIVAPMSEGVNFRLNELVNIIEITFSRPIRGEGLEERGKPQSVLVVRPGAEVSTGQRLSGDLKLVEPNIARFYLRQPSSVPSGHWRLMVLAQAMDQAPPVRAADDDTVLDGNYDNEPGQDFVLPFVVHD